MSAATAKDTSLSSQSPLTCRGEAVDQPRLIHQSSTARMRRRCKQGGSAARTARAGWGGRSSGGWQSAQKHKEWQGKRAQRRRSAGAALAAGACLDKHLLQGADADAVVQILDKGVDPCRAWSAPRPHLLRTVTAFLPSLGILCGAREWPTLRRKRDETRGTKFTAGRHPEAEGEPRGCARLRCSPSSRAGASPRPGSAA